MSTEPQMPNVGRAVVADIMRGLPANPSDPEIIVATLRYCAGMFDPVGWPSKLADQIDESEQPSLAETAQATS